MTTIIPVIILILSMLIFLFLQILPGTFAIFYHFALAKFSRKKSDDLSLSFILGTEIFMATSWLLVYSIVYAIFTGGNFNNPSFSFFLLGGITFALAIVSATCYFRRGKTTATFLPRRIVNGIIARIIAIKTQKDAIILGFFTGVFELIFTLPIIVAANIILQNTGAIPRALVIIIAIICTIIPLFIIRWFFRHDYNLADIERLRIKLKPHYRIILCLTFFALTLALINLGIISHG